MFGPDIEKVTFHVGSRWQPRIDFGLVLLTLFSAFREFNAVLCVSCFIPYSVPSILYVLCQTGVNKSPVESVYIEDTPGQITDLSRPRLTFPRCMIPPTLAASVNINIRIQLHDRFKHPRLENMQTNGRDRAHIIIGYKVCGYFCPDEWILHLHFFK